MPSCPKASSSHFKNGATSSSLEVNDVGRCKSMQRKFKSNITTNLRRIPSDSNNVTIDPLLYADWWSSVYAWWCLSLWPCLSWFFVLIVGVLWIFYLQWHQCLVGFFFCTSHLLVIPFPMLNPMDDVWRNWEQQQRNNANNKMLSPSPISTLKQVEEKMALLSSP
jgi:hypothetical protein